jgi:hypothetical protein
MESNMDTVEARMTNLFQQLGLDASAEGIAGFIGNHQLPADVHLVDAPFWNNAQRQMLDEMLKANAKWAPIVDQLNEVLHEPRKLM